MLSGSGASWALLGTSEVILRHYERDAAGPISSWETLREPAAAGSAGCGVVELLIHVDQYCPVLNFACVHRDARDLGYTDRFAVWRLNRAAWAAHTRVSSSWTVPSCKGCC